MINVTQPFLPPLEEYSKYLKGLWERKWLTNNGPLVNEFELRLKQYLNVNHLLFLGNGTIALQIAIKALRLAGEIITTPFSYVATTSSIVWEGCSPVFVDIDRQTLNIDPELIVKSITKNTSAILATHVFGNPCAVDELQKIANNHGLKLIYDAAHGFGTKVKGRSIFEYGDVSTTSFHATKLFHTIEGGAVFTKDKFLLEQMALLRNFGHHGPEEFRAVGINGKNSEFHAAMGLANFGYISEILAKRKYLSELYDQRLEGLKVQRIQLHSQIEYNFAYYPIIFRSEESLLKSITELNANWIYPRRYFWPSLNTISYTRGNFVCPVSEDVSKRILCLPLFHSMNPADISLIGRLLLRAQNN
ncbi:MAG: DegT/DnrJ/EryC1/StrS family aminotransferase [Cyclobacteriaceae bacterium]|nr:DegT/DnrJ/EryC1/StrS family aminotransferase [Cyclobacteriaceae bacterium]